MTDIIRRLYVLQKFKNELNKTKNQNGGKLLGEGGFGCVISPPLKCKRTFNKSPYSIDNNYISKIVEYDEDDSEIMNELNLGDKILKVDPRQRYFSPIINGCFLHRQKNNDLKYSKTKKDDASSKSSESSNSKSNNDTEYKKINKCNIYLNEKYMNLISKYAGINLEDAFDNKDYKLNNYIIDNYYDIMKHFCKGLLILKKRLI